MKTTDQSVNGVRRTLSRGLCQASVACGRGRATVTEQGLDVP